MKARGFTLLEMLVVLMVVALLASIAAPVVTKTVDRAREATLKEDLFVMRKALDDYLADHGYYPESLDALVEERYLRTIPPDPITERPDSWTATETQDESGRSGIVDLHSGAEGVGSNGLPYSEW